MPPSKRVLTESEKSKIIELCKKEVSQADIAEELGVSPGWINGIIKTLRQAGLLPIHEYSQTKNANAAVRWRSTEARRVIHEEAVSKAQDILRSTTKPKDLRDWAVAWGVILDKYRLEDPPQGVNGAAAIDSFIEELKREAAEDEQKAKR